MYPKRKHKGFKTLVIFCMMFAINQPLFASHVTVEIHSDVGLFYEELTPYGEWFDTKDFGRIWVPSSTPLGWRPYTLGHWSYNDDYGWVWTSYWQWGWATFHYGRWFNHTDYGWAWIPGTQWAPAWVVWRSGNGWLGWAPLPPSADWRSDKGLTASAAEIDHALPFHAWSFVPEAGVFSRELHTKEIAIAGRNVTLLSQTQPLIRYAMAHGHIVSQGIDIQQLALPTKILVPRVRLIDVTYPEGLNSTKVAKGELAVFRPTLDLVTEVPLPPLAVIQDKLYTVEQMKKRHGLTQRAMQLYHDAERRALEQVHNTQGGQANPQQQTDEKSALEELHRWEQQVLDFRLQRELDSLGRK